MRFSDTYKNAASPKAKPAWLLVVNTILSLCLAHPAGAQRNGAANLRGGKEIWEAGCVACHGFDGKGTPDTTVGFEKPETFPDFTRCDQTTPEPNTAWKSVIRDGGPSRGFSQIMPSFSETLTPEQIDAVVGYMRGFCVEKRWPRGELNLPRALFTEKAFPEDESIVTTTLNVKGTPGVTEHLIYEKRLDMRNQVEVDVPIAFVRQGPGLWYGGPGDVTLALKHVTLFSQKTGSLVSLQGGFDLPTGNRAHNLGSGVTSFETFASYAQLLPQNFFAQLQGGAGLPFDTSKAPQNVFFRTAIGKSFMQNHGLGRLWSPMLEWVGERDLVDGAKSMWNVVPEFQVTLSRRQHIRFAVGVSIPAVHTKGRDPQLTFYLLWDRLDGGLLEGWR